MITKVLKNNSHHAYAIEGEGKEIRKELWDFFEREWGIVTQGNPDFSDQTFVSFGIDEARALKSLQENHAFEGGKKIFVVEAHAMTGEAQNSLLKMFEEPTENTHFFLMGECVKNLLPTLASRVFRVRDSGAPPSVAEGGAGREFLSVSKPERLAIIKKLSDDIKNEKKTKADGLALLHEIENYLYKETKRKGELPGKVFEDLELCRDYLGDRSASVKMLLEYVALVVPSV